MYVVHADTSWECWPPSIILQLFALLSSNRVIIILWWCYIPRLNFRPGRHFISKSCQQMLKQSYVPVMYQVKTLGHSRKCHIDNPKRVLNSHFKSPKSFIGITSDNGKTKSIWHVLAAKTFLHQGLNTLAILACYPGELIGCKRCEEQHLDLFNMNHAFMLLTISAVVLVLLISTKELLFGVL